MKTFALIMTCVSLAGCLHPPPSVSAAAQPPDSRALRTQQAMVQALAALDSAPECTRVERLSRDPATDLLAVLQRADVPPWVTLRAADCLLLGHPAAVEVQTLAWVSAPGHRDLALLTIAELESLPPALAESVVEAALSGPYALETRERLAFAESPVLQALARR